jgi:hypothetical protein
MFVANTAHTAEMIRLAVTDVEGFEQLQREFGAFRDVLSKNSGITDYKRCWPKRY